MIIAVLRGKLRRWSISTTYAVSFKAPIDVATRPIYKHINMSNPTHKRVRTEEQLARKRYADRLNHKARREKDKSRVHQLEADAEKLRCELSALRAEVQELKSATNKRLTSVAASTTWRPDSPLLARYVVSEENYQEIGGQQCPSPQLPRTELVQILAESYSIPAINASIQSMSPSIRWPLFVFCVCGIGHKCKTECLEYACYQILLKAQVTLLNGIRAHVRLLPTPSLSQLLLQSTDDNPIVATMAAVFQCHKMSSIPVRFGLYILMYRLLRVRSILQ